MSRRIEDNALLGDRATTALVGMDGAIDWFCVPRFDSQACFAAILGEPENGFWRVAPKGRPRRVRRAYRHGTLVLDTEFETGTGAIRLTDFMPVTNRDGVDIVRVVTGLRGHVAMDMEVRFRFEYGQIVPWVRRDDGSITAIAGSNALRLAAEIGMEGRGMATVAAFDVAEGQSVPMVLTCYPSFRDPPPLRDAYSLLDSTVAWWRDWSDRCQEHTEWHDAVLRSAITLKALTHRETGGIVAAATTSLPEEIGGKRNWDYRYCWLRDATFSLYALMVLGYTEEADAWRRWLLRAVAGDPSELQIMYDVAGERRLDEHAVDWLSGYANSRPVRIGNDAYRQSQLDVYGEVMDAFHGARHHGIEPDDNSWNVQLALMAHVVEHWKDPGSGLWEQRSDPQRYVYSTAMAWVAADRCVKATERFGLSGPADDWRKLRRIIHDDVCRHGFSEKKNAFVQRYGSDELDASALLLALVRFLPIEDPRIQGTIEAVKRELMSEGFVYRYDADLSPDGVPGGEGAFIACTLWLADNLALAGRDKEAREIFERVLDIRNDVGLLSEEYDPIGKRLLGNFPQAFSHVALINTAHNLAEKSDPRG